jgi:hypothetical protein
VKVGKPEQEKRVHVTLSVCTPVVTQQYLANDADITENPVKLPAAG